jgi:hypothetical protein
MRYVLPAVFGKYLFSDGKMGMMGCPKIYVHTLERTPHILKNLGSRGCAEKKSLWSLASLSKVASGGRKQPKSRHVVDH